jgi:signal transduction histidine kinase
LRAAGGGRADAFEILDSVFTALSPPLVLEVVLAFVGGARRHRRPRLAAWIVFGGLSVSALGALTSPALARWIDDPRWSIIFMLGYVPSFAFEVVLLGRHLRSTSDPQEKARARTVLAALAIGGSFSLSDVAHAAGLPAPHLAALGTVITAGLLTTLVLRLALFDRNVSARTSLYVLGMIAAFVVAYLVVLSALAGRLAVQMFAASILTLLVAAVARELALSVAETRARTQRLAVLGRFSAQMAHDIRGPLTALVGAVQVLDGAGDDKDTQKEFLGLVSEQARRIGTIVDRYDRMARVEPRKTVVRVNEVVRAVARAHGVPDDAAHLRLAAGDLECDADAALLESALENVVRNAMEASNDAAAITLETETPRDGAPRVVIIRVRDRGPGMDARVVERAVEDFFTTKVDGSGLGLAFVRRVLEAHGGSMTLASRPAPHAEQGTTVELRLPL